MKFRKHDRKRQKKNRTFVVSDTAAVVLFLGKSNFYFFEWPKNRLGAGRSARITDMFFNRFLSASVSGIASPFGNKLSTNRTTFPVKYHDSPPPTMKFSVNEQSSDETFSEHLNFCMQSKRKKKDYTHRRKLNTSHRRCVVNPNHETTEKRYSILKEIWEWRKADVYFRKSLTIVDLAFILRVWRPCAHKRARVYSYFCANDYVLSSLIIHVCTYVSTTLIRKIVHNYGHTFYLFNGTRERTSARRWDWSYLCVFKYWNSYMNVYDITLKRTFKI